MTASHWQARDPRRFVRDDGALVKWDDDTPYSNPVNPNARMWTAWEPDPGERALTKRLRRRPHSAGVPRRFKTALAAMKAADKRWPLVEKGGAR